jgi:hypothetical protein
MVSVRFVRTEVRTVGVSGDDGIAVDTFLGVPFRIQKHVQRVREEANREYRGNRKDAEPKGKTNAQKQAEEDPHPRAPASRNFEGYRVNHPITDGAKSCANLVHALDIL